MSAMRVRTDYRSLSGMEKAAMFMLSLSEELLRSCSTTWATKRSRTVVEYGQSRRTVPKLSNACMSILQIDFVDGSLTGTPESTERLPSKVLGGDRVSQIMEELRAGRADHVG